MLDDIGDNPQKTAAAPAQNSEAHAPGRHPNSLANLERHKSQPGQSGNPGGRPKKVREVADRALEGSTKAIEALITALDKELAKDDPNPHTIAMLSDRIMDRGLGKPGQSLDVNRETQLTLSNLPRTDHMYAAEHSARYTVAWIKARFAGQRATRLC